MISIFAIHRKARVLCVSGFAVSRVFFCINKLDIWRTKYPKPQRNCNRNSKIWHLYLLMGRCLVHSVKTITLLIESVVLIGVVNIAWSSRKTLRKNSSYQQHPQLWALWERRRQHTPPSVIFHPHPSLIFLSK